MGNVFDNLGFAKEPCQGQIFKAEKRWYIDKQRGYNLKLRIIPVIRKSCKCCDWDFDLSEGSIPINISEIKDGELYKIIPVNCSTDFETGYLDGYDLKLIEYIEEK